MLAGGETTGFDFKVCAPRRAREGFFDASCAPSNAHSFAGRRSDGVTRANFFDPFGIRFEPATLTVITL